MKQNKTLHVVRHAKSSWEYDGIADIDRTLKSKGIRNAYEISRKMKLDHFVPQRIVSSPANRALHTAVIFARVFGLPMENFEIHPVLYETEAERILDYVKSLPDDINSLMICGHNPDFTSLANYFLKETLGEIPTSGVVTLKFKTQSWKAIGRDSLDLHFFHFPVKED
jgi:phosphohistidine phosphatase